MHVREFLNDFTQKDFSQISPDAVFRDYFRGRSSIVSKLNSQLVRNYDLVANPGFKVTEKFFVTAVRNVSFISIIAREGGGQEISEMIRRTRSTCIFPKYNRKSFKAVLEIVVAMHLQKYDAASMTPEHLVYIALCTMWYFFRIYDDEFRWIIDPKDVFPVTNEIIRTDVSVFEEIAVKYGFSSKSFTDSEKYIISNDAQKRPESREELMAFISDDMTQTEKKHAIMDRYFVGDRTARKIMAQFGLTNKKYERSDYAELHAHIEEAKEEVVDRIDGVSGQVDEVSDKIDGIEEKMDVLRDDFRTAFTEMKRVFMGGNFDG